MTSTAKRRHSARTYAIALGVVMAASFARAQTIVSVSGVNDGVILDPANGNVVVDIQFTLSQVYNNVSIAAPLLGNSSNSVADFYLTTQVGAGTTSANAIASNTGVTLPAGTQYVMTTLFSGLTLPAGSYNLVFGGVSGFPILGYTFPGPGTVTQSPVVSYDYLSTQLGAVYEPASTLSSTTVAFNFQVTGTPLGLGAGALVVGSAAGASSVMLADSLPWTASSNSSFLHISSGSASGAGSAVVAFTYDALTGAGTRTGTLTIAGLILTVTQAGAGYIGPSGAPITIAQAYLPQNAWFPVTVDGSGNVYFFADQSGVIAVQKWSPSTQQTTTVVALGKGGTGTFLEDAIGLIGLAADGAGNIYIVNSASPGVLEWNASTQQLITLVSGPSSPGAVATDRYGSGSESQVSLFRPRFQAAQGSYRTNPTENVSASRIKATSGHSGDLQGNVRGNANLAGANAILKSQFLPQLICTARSGEKSGLAP